MTESDEEMRILAQKVRVAIETADLSSFGELLDPDVRWGPPGASRPPCTNRDDVLAWYRRAMGSGARARVNDVTILGDLILLGLVVTRTEAAEERGGSALRWQVLTVRAGRIIDIVGFEDRVDALAHVGAPAET
ncbi:MAG: nuclear transport factor 2 family protein [Acidimicrobiales bacterium]